MFYLIYEIRNLLNGKFYIGAHTTKNLNDGYFGSGKLLKRAIRKYGKENFIKNTLYMFTSEDDMYLKEAEIVNQAFIDREDTYNVKLGGSGGFDHINSVLSKQEYIERSKYGTKKLKEKIATDADFKKRMIERCSTNGKNNRDKKIGIFSEEVQKRLKENKKGKQWIFHTEEFYKQLGQNNSKRQKGKGNSQYGKIWMFNENLKKSIKIYPNLLDEYIKLGWKRGRKMKF